MNNQGSSKSLLPLVEIIISIGIFAVAVVLTLQLFLLAKFLGNKTSDTARAIFEIQSIAENIKLLKNDAEIESFITGGENNAVKSGTLETFETCTLYYGEKWQPVLSESDAAFVMKINVNKNSRIGGSLYEFNLNLYKSSPYPFINDKDIKADSGYIPLLASVNASNFIVK